ncbi:aspartate ammonia-lyase [Cognatishimia sp. SS12]|uniref:aspartate ammonia-lyase n=1 Tax=Cognatishimia sp. SS12 TaxID=2979465 RepID=UPI0023304CB5|nr:aspartate ammonia-lyase [Cognatishimia sp. SS12]MDC0738291.1 aspartate ammonia-lyase [Cognatishimia sp. SS12]
MTGTRTETDSLGTIDIPPNAAWGTQTQRAIDNFPITGVSISHYPELVVGLAQVKKACALANNELNGLPDKKAETIIAVCDEIIGGAHHEQFVVDVMQGGAGTSTNMNANEVIANLCLSKLGHGFGDYAHLHPNDDVNRAQSTNDVYPTAIRLAVLARIKPLIDIMHGLTSSFDAKGAAFDHITKVGRTQLQDAVPMSLGAEFRGFATTIREDIQRLSDLSQLLTEVNLGGTAIGTRINAPANFGETAVAHLRRITGEPLGVASDLIEASSDLGAFVMFSSALKRVAIKLSKICNDLRLMSSGPRAGIGEIMLPPVQAGSSIMPGKVNPVIPEVVNQVCYQAIGNDLTVTMAAEAGQFQLNAMEPVIIHKVLETMGSLTNAMTVLRTRCVDGIVADEARCKSLLENSLVHVTSLAPVIGYEAATKLAKYAQAHGLSLVAAADSALAEVDAQRAKDQLTKLTEGSAHG